MTGKSGISWLAAVVVSVAGLLSGLPAAAEAPPKLEFLPPRIRAQKVCPTRQTDLKLLQVWRRWDGSSSKGMDVQAVKDAMRRLRDLNAAENFAMVGRMLDLLQKLDKSAARSDIDADRITLFIAAGKFGELAQSRLVQKLSAQETALSPKALAVLSDVYSGGLGVPIDEARGMHLLIQSAYGGNPDSLLKIAELSLSGKKPPGWDLEPNLVVSMAFGALVGDLDPGICGRIGRIAREYQKGVVVAQDNEIAARWLRLAADLGDASSAWEFAKLQLDAENLAKDNDALLKYLRMAADAEIPAARVELGKILETGALASQDLQAARTLYEQASQAGYRSGLIRLAALLGDGGEKDSGAYGELLAQLSANPDPPGWVFSKLARMVSERDGRWAGEAKAVALLEKGVAAGDTDSYQMLAALLLRHGNDRAAFNRAIDLLTYEVTTMGMVDPMIDLRDAYLCRDPSGPNLRLVEYWRKSEAEAGTSTPTYSQGTLASLSPNNNPAILAQLQSHALNGRPRAVAYYYYYLQRAKAPAATIEFWRERIATNTTFELAYVNEALEGAAEGEDIDRALVALDAAAGAGNQDAQVALAGVLLDHFPKDPLKRSEAVERLDKAALAGNGQAMKRLAASSADRPQAVQTVYDKYRDVVEARGDTDALLFAAAGETNKEDKRRLLQRASGIMPCTFENATSMARAYQLIGDTAEADRWLTIASQFVSGNPWRTVAIADILMSFGDKEHRQQAVGFYEDALAAGDATSAMRLVKLFGDQGSGFYAPERAASMLVEMLRKVEADKIVDLLSKVRKLPAAIQERVFAEVAVIDLYQPLAQAGNAIAMRELGKIIRDKGTGIEDARKANAWFERASAKGDSQAMVELAKAYAWGLGTNPSIERAMELLRMAANSGDREASEMLAKMSK